MVCMPRLSSFPSCWSLVELCTCVEVFRVGERREDKEGAGGKRRIERSSHKGEMGLRN